MPTLADITAAHSERISRITQRRDHRLQDATAARDHHLRALPRAIKLYDAFEKQVGDARKQQLATDGKAEAARAGALQRVSDGLAAALERAHGTRRDADTAAFEQRRNADAEIEHEFILAIAAAGGKSSSEAQKIRADKLARSKNAFDEALRAAQEQFRQSRDAALIAEAQGARDANRGYVVAAKASESSLKSVRAAAEQKLAAALGALPDAAAEFQAWRAATAAIVADYRREEAQEFERFHKEIEALKE